MNANEIIEVRALLKLLAQRCELGLGSLALVEKQLQSCLDALDNLLQKLYDEPIRGEEENSDLEFFISLPLEVYTK